MSMTSFVEKILSRPGYDKFSRPGLDLGEYPPPPVLTGALEQGHLVGLGVRQVLMSRAGSG